MECGGASISITNQYENTKEFIDYRVITQNWGNDNIKSEKTIYLSGILSTLKTILTELKKDFQIIQLNSFFSFRWTILPLIIIKLLCLNSKVIITPRGELNSYALKEKKFRKNFYIYLFKFFLNTKLISFLVSNSFEKNEAKKIINKNKINIAEDFLPNYKDFKSKHKKFDNKLVFISHLKKTKNLDFALQVLKKLPEKIGLDVYGNIDDGNYYDFCIKTIQDLNLDKRVTFHGKIDDENVVKTFSKYKIFIFPSKTENFGYVILESMLAGTIPIISRNTPWTSKHKKSLLALELDQDDWAKQINEILSNNDYFKSLSKSSRRTANDYLIKANKSNNFIKIINEY